MSDTMFYLIPDHNRPGKQRLITNHFGWLEDHIHCLVGPFSHEDEAREEAHAIEIAAANRLPEKAAFELTESGYDAFVNNPVAW